MKRLLLLLAGTVAAFGQSPAAIDLSGEWRRSADDRPEYAQPDFDDRAWGTVRIPWTARPAFGRCWLRRTVDVPHGFRLENAFITLGPVAETYDLYVNGWKVGNSGSFTDPHVLQLARSRTFPLPPGLPAQRLQVSLRIQRLNSAQSLVIFQGGSYAVTRTAPTLDSENLLAILQQRTSQSINLVIAAILLSSAMLFGILWLAERRRTELLWLGLLAACRAVLQVAMYGGISLDTHPYPIPLAAELAHALSGVALAELILAFTRVPARWLRVLFWTCWSLHFFLHAPTYFGAYYDLVALAVLLYGWRQQQITKARLTWIALTLVTLSHINVHFRFFPTSVELAGYDFNLTSSALAVLSFLLVFLSLQLLIADRREKQRLAGELEAARTVQQLLLPASAACSEAFDVSAVYEPAQEVGGDFHWTRVTPDGALVVVVGDVSGKGLKAAMLVSVAIGILRTEQSTSPARVLATMNEGLAGHTGGGFVTCSCARFDLDGRVTLANAGHPAPYVDGRELEVEAGLPLGIATGVAYPECPAAGARFTFVSDGLVEAANAKGELFGFDRTREISGKSAHEIAETAKAWGQNDDITVVVVRRIE